MRGATVSPLIIGGGPAGAAAAILLARAGHNVMLIERRAGPHDKVCGDFLSADALAAVAAIGVDLVPLAPAPVRQMRIVCGDISASTALPFPAVGLSRRLLDEALLAGAVAAGVRLLRGSAVRSLRRNGVGWVADVGAHGWITADTVFLATGKHDLRGVMRPKRGDLVGLKTYLALASDQLAALSETIELTLFAGGYAGLQRIEDGRVVLCWLMPSETLRRIGAWPAALEWLMQTSPNLARRLSGVQAVTSRPIAVAGIPYGFVHREPDHPGLFRLGDQASVIPSLAGDGVAIALYSGSLAARVWLASGTSEATYHHRLRRGVGHPIRIAGLVHHLCRNSVMQPWAVTACRCWPGLMRWLARETRVIGCGSP